MSKEIDCQGIPHCVGDCVEVSTWMHDDSDGFFVPARCIGLVLESELVDMDDPDGENDGKEWLYRVSLPDGRVTEVWDYEVKHVNSNIIKYNNISHPANRRPNGKDTE